MDFSQGAGPKRLNAFSIPPKMNVLKTGFPSLDGCEALCEGVGRVMVVAAGTGVGKSILLNQMALNVAEQGKRVLIITPEMSGSEVKQRLLQIKLSTDSKGLYNCDPIILAELEAEIEALDLFVDETRPAEYNLICNRVHELSRIKPLDLIIIDYIRIMSKQGVWNKKVEMQQIMMGLNNLADKKKCPIILAAQLNRDFEKRAIMGNPKTARPLMSDIADAADIERWSDIVMFINRPWFFDKSIAPQVAEFIVDKHRHGQTGVYNVRFEGGQTKFIDHGDVI